MTTGTPPELQDYHQYRESSFKHFLLWAFNRGVIGGALIGCVLGLFVFGYVGWSIALIGCFVGIFVLVFLAGYCQGRFGKLRFYCSKCRQPMHTLDLPAPMDIAGVTRTSSPWLKGADGLLYWPDSDRTGKGAWFFTICQRQQRWSVCQKCRRCFPGMDSVLKPILQTRDGERYEHARRLLESDPDAVRKIKEGSS